MAEERGVHEESFYIWMRFGLGYFGKNKNGRKVFTRSGAGRLNEIYATLSDKMNIKYLLS